MQMLTIPRTEIFVRFFFLILRLHLKHLKLVWNTTTLSIHKLKRLWLVSATKLWLWYAFLFYYGFCSFFSSKYYTFHFFPSTIVMLPFIDEHYLRAIKTRYLWQTRVHIQPLLSPPTTNKTYRVLQRICSSPGLHDSEEL